MHGLRRVTAVKRLFCDIFPSGARSAQQRSFRHLKASEGFWGVSTITTPSAVLMKPGLHPTKPVSTYMLSFSLFIAFSGSIGLSFHLSCSLRIFNPIRPSNTSMAGPVQICFAFPLNCLYNISVFSRFAWNVQDIIR